MLTKHVNSNALMDITSRPANVFVQGEGSYIWDSDGRRYLDFVQGWAVNCLGHAPAQIVNALELQARQLITPSPAYYNAASIELAEKLVRLSCFDRVFFTNSGAEAIEGAIKLARRYGEFHKAGAYEIITFDDAFHGRTLATMSASGKKSFANLFEPKVPGFPKAMINDIASVKRLISNKTIAVMLEPVQGEAGVWPANNEFLRELRELTEANGLLLIVDEIQTGIGRTGRMFHYEYAGISPDIMALGKGIGGGVPLGALLASDQASCFRHGDQGGTYNGNPLMCAVGSAVIDAVSQPEFLAGVVEQGAYLVKEIDRLSQMFGLGPTRGHGLLIALDLASETSGQIAEKALDKGLLVNAPRPDTLRFMPALNVSENEIDEAVAILEEIFSDQF
ncbi:MAG: acetylornithine transaminase [Hyphomicrobiaceae bacterium]